MGYSAVQFVTIQPMFRWNMSPPFSGLNGKTYKKQHEAQTTIHVVFLINLK
jgi:hypothetical protein